MKKVPRAVSITASFALIAMIFAAYLVSHDPKQAPALGAPEENAISAPSFAHPFAIGGTELEVAMAVTAAEQTQGLSGTPPLADGQGMLFVFAAPNLIPFWMKDMNYPLDIIWIGSDKTVIGISPDLAPTTYPSSFSSPVPDQYALEVPGGFAAANHISVGEQVSF